MNHQNNIIKCSFCNWTTLRWYTKNGKRHSGYFKLENHVVLNHEKEYESIIRKLDELEVTNHD